MTVLDPRFHAAILRQATPNIRRTRWETPGDLARELDRRTVTTPALDLIDDHLSWVVSGPDRKLIVSMPPQEGKTRRVNRDFVTWALHDNPERRVVCASHDLGLARRNGREVRDFITNNGDKLQLAIRADLHSQTEWQLVGHIGGVYAAGIGGSLTGRPADLLVIDDPIKDRKQADSELWRERQWDWWTDVASARLAPGAPVVLVLTRWHEDDLAGRLLASEDGHAWRLLNIPAEADHNPADGELDPLQRDPGEFMVSARGRTVEQWQARKRIAGARTWAALYQGRPAPAEGETFKRSWWNYYDQSQWIVRDDGAHIPLGFDQVTQSWDMAFKDTAGADMVVGQVWGRRGPRAFLLDSVRRRMDFPDTIKAFRALTAKWPTAVGKYVEDKANGPAAISLLSQTIPGIIPVTPEGSKTARANAVSPLVEAGNVWLPAPEVAPWVADFVEELATFPNATFDDQVDAMSQALDRMLIIPFPEGETFDMGDLDPEVAGYEITPF